MEKFEEEYTLYEHRRDQLCGFYNQVGILTDFELRNGYESYDALKM